MNIVMYYLLIQFSSLLIGQNDTTTEPSNDPVEWITFEPENVRSNGKKIVLISGDEEYRSEETLSQLGKILAYRHGFTCTVLFAQDPVNTGIINPNYTNHIPGLELLEKADLMILFTRFRDLPTEQMKYIDDYLSYGRPVIGIRTATHAFRFKDPQSKWAHYGNYFEDDGSSWNGGFGRLVLGEKWVAHHGHHRHQSTRGIISKISIDHPIVHGIADGDIWGPTDVYRVRLPLPGDSQPIVFGQVIERAGDYDEEDLFFGMRPADSKLATKNSNSGSESYDPNTPSIPIAWTKSYQLPGGQNGMAFTATIGSSTDFLNEGVRRLFVNATYYLLNLDVPQKTDVQIVGEYSPSPYGFHPDEYWIEKSMSISSFQAR